MKQASSRDGLPAALAAIALVMLPVLYVFSIGPVLGMVDKGWLPDEVMMTYYPLIMATDRSPPLMQALEQYAELWAGPRNVGVGRPSPAPVPASAAPVGAPCS